MNISQFHFSIEDGGTKAVIIETVGNREFSPSTDFGGVKWLYEGLKKARQRINDVNFFSKYQASYALFLLQRWNNKNGSFICLSKLQQGEVRKVIIFPAGQEGVGWTEAAEAMYRLVFAPSNIISKQSEEKTKHQKQGKNHGATVRHSEGNSMTYAEVTGLEPMKNNRWRVRENQKK